MTMLEQACKSLYGALGYEFTEKGLDDSMKKIISASESYRKFSLWLSDGQTAYVCIGHKAKDASKLPNLTYVPNIPATETATGKHVIILGQTFGHHHDNENDGMQEIYEFRGFGAIIIDRDNTDTVDFVVAKEGDKIAVPTHCNMTILNLDYTPLMTLDYANPNNNRANKKLQERIGPLLCAYIDNGIAVFEINENYINQRNDYGAGVNIIPQNPVTQIEFNVGNHQELDQMIYYLLLDDDAREKFGNVGINVIPAEKSIVLGNQQYHGSLLELIAIEDKSLHRELGFENVWKLKWQKWNTSV